jgi:hypothetical protein
MSIPMSRDEMRGMKAKKDEELRIEKVKNRVTHTYEQAIKYAETNAGTFYSLDIDPGQTCKRVHQMNISINKSCVGFSNSNDNYQYKEYQFYKDNMTEILSGLQDLFPGCTVKLAKMCTGNDGKRYDISTMDEKMLPFINQQQAFECIVIDWS